MADENVTWINASMDVNTKERLEKMASDDDRSLSAEIRMLINKEWAIRQARHLTVSVETLDNSRPAPSVPGTSV